MSCLPWASWAAKKAAQIVGESGGGSTGEFALPIVEIADITAISTEENAKLTACMGMPIILVAAGNAVLCSSTIMDGDFPWYSNTDLGVIIGTVDGAHWALVETT